jgi:glycyl-tRNA synthetase alpha chain
MYNFRQVQQSLEKFWKSQGVTILLPYDLEMGAATYSPFSTIKMLEKNNLSVGFIQKCRRPYDSMGGQRGNRLYSFHQFQVMLKGLWPTVVEQFIKSLEYIGLDVKNQDIKFVESDWNSPSIGAYGVGWEVQLSGMEIAQFTYFKKIALQDCSEPITELTYGVERLLLKLTQKNNIYECMWDDHNSYKNIVEFYEKDFKNMGMMADQIASLDDFHKYLNYGNLLIDNHSIYHGYEYILKACHVYNLLELANKISGFQRTILIKKLQESFSKTVNQS